MSWPAEAAVAPGTAVDTASPLRAEILDIAALNALGDGWDRLFGQAAVKNPYFSRPVVLGHLGQGLAPGNLRFAAVLQGRRLLALLPVVPDRRWLGLTWTAWRSDYMNDVTPLIDGDTLVLATDALLAALDRVGRPVSLPLLPQDTPVAQTLVAALVRRGWRTTIRDPFRRAVLDLGRRPDIEAYFADELSRNRVKGLRRRRRRLDALGTVAHQVATGSDLPDAVERFLALEAAGWKGRAGTALLSRPETAAFARDLFTRADGPVRGRADLLSLDGRVIAASLAFVTGGVGYMMKTAYDETLASVGPGLLLEEAIIRDVHATGACTRLDSASLAGGVLETLYADAQPIADLLIAPPSVVPAAFRLFGDAHRLRSAAIRRLKAVLARRRRGQATVPQGSG